MNLCLFLRFSTNISGTIEDIKFPFDREDLKKISKNSDLLITQTVINLPDSTQKIELDSIRFSSQDSALVISNFSLTPNMSAEQHFKHYQWNKGYQKLHIKEIRVAYPQIDSNSTIRISRLSISRVLKFERSKERRSLSEHSCKLCFSKEIDYRRQKYVFSPIKSDSTPSLRHIFKF